MFVSIPAVLALLFTVGSVSSANLGSLVKSASKYPFAVRIVFKYEHERTKAENIYACGGVIFSPTVILTAAHCLYHKFERVAAIRVTAGKVDYAAPSPNQQEVLVKGYRIHKDYKYVVRHLVSPKEYRLNDIAILWLKEALFESATVKQATFAANSIRTEIVGIGLGFHDKKLYQVPLKAVSYHTCRNVKKHYNGPNTFCAMPVENASCRNTKGDSGSAFVYDNKVIGLVSFGSTDDQGNVCEDMPIVMTDVSKHAATIAKYLREGPPKKTCPKPQGKYCALP